LKKKIAELEQENRTLKQGGSQPAQPQQQQDNRDWMKFGASPAAMQRPATAS